MKAYIYNIDYFFSHEDLINDTNRQTKVIKAENKHAALYQLGQMVKGVIIISIQRTRKAQ